MVYAPEAALRSTQDNVAAFIPESENIKAK
jgi:hypothetical protein